MAVRRLDHVSVVVDDLEAAEAFFVELGLVVEGRSPVAGAWVDAVVGVEGVQVDIVMMATPDGHGKLELTRWTRPPAKPSGVPEPPTAPGLRSVMFAVDDIEGTVERLGAHGATLIGEVARYEDAYLLCYLRGPGGAIVALAEEL